MATVLVNDPIHADGVRSLTNAGHEVVEDHLEGDALTKALSSARGLIVRSGTKVTREVLEAAPELAVVGRAGVGVDNIDLEAAEERGVVVANTPGASTNAVAELTLTHMLAAARKLPLAHHTMRDGEWAKKRCRGVELRGRTLGLVGIGRIGARVAGLAQAFSMTVEAFDPYISEAQAGELGVILHDDLLDLARGADVISVHTPLTPETRGIVGEEFFDAAKDGLIVVNCARGGVVDEQALLMALRSGRVYGAGLDVFEEEPPGKTELVVDERVSTTPHIGAATEEAQRQAGLQVARAVRAVLDGEEPENRVV